MMDENKLRGKKHTHARRYRGKNKQTWTHTCSQSSRHIVQVTSLPQAASSRGTRSTGGSTYSARGTMSRISIVRMFSISAGLMTKKPLRPSASLDWNCPRALRRHPPCTHMYPHTSTTMVQFRRSWYVCVHATRSFPGLKMPSTVQSPSSSCPVPCSTPVVPSATARASTVPCLSYATHG